MSNKIKTEDHPKYGAIPPLPQAMDDVLLKKERMIIAQALDILYSRINEKKFKIDNPDDTINYLKLKLVPLEHEIFAVMFLDNRHQVIQYEEIFRGTIDGAAVYPREVIKLALVHNAAAVIFAHNHPSGDPTPSNADHTITKRLIDACKLVDIRVLDHIIIGGTEIYSFANHGDI